MTKLEVTIDELIETLKRTSLPTVLVEGSDDMIVFRKIEERIKNKSIDIDILPVGGRSKIIEILRRRNEIPNGKTIAFVADKDYWVVTGVPAEFSGKKIIFTHGYSIENDTIIDGDLVNLLSGNQILKFQNEINKFLRWYAYELSRHINDNSVKISHHPDHVLEMLHISQGDINNISGYPHSMLEILKQNYLTHIRGKSLMSLIIRNASHGKNKTPHNPRSLLATVAARPGQLISKIERDIESAITS